MLRTVLAGCSMTALRTASAATGSPECRTRSDSSRSAYTRPRGSLPRAMVTVRVASLPGSRVKLSGGPWGARADTTTISFEGVRASVSYWLTDTPFSVSARRNSFAAHRAGADAATGSDGSITSETCLPPVWASAAGAPAAASPFRKSRRSIKTSRATLLPLLKDRDRPTPDRTRPETTFRRLPQSAK